MNVALRPHKNAEGANCQDRCRHELFICAIVHVTKRNDESTRSEYDARERCCGINKEIIHYKNQLQLNRWRSVKESVES